MWYDIPVGRPVTGLPSFSFGGSCVLDVLSGSALFGDALCFFYPGKAMQAKSNALVWRKWIITGK